MSAHQLINYKLLDLLGRRVRDSDPLFLTVRDDDHFHLARFQYVSNHNLQNHALTRLVSERSVKLEVRILNMLLLMQKDISDILQMHRRSQDFVWGCTFLLKKVNDLFLVVALKRPSKTTK